MNQLNGQAADAQYVVQGVVTKKYAPKYQQEHFYVQLDGGLSLFVHEDHYATFDVGDIVGVWPSESHDHRSWVRAGDDLAVLQKATPEVRELEVRLGYVSEPKKIGGEYWYLANVNDSWYRIPYEVAARYWLGDTTSKSEAMQGSYYDLLGVGRNASVERVQEAWRALVRQHHPDLYPTEQRDYQGQVTARLNVARDTLCDPDERGRYDQQLQEPDADDAGVRAWPGRGFGTLRCVAEVRGDSFMVTRLLSWANEEVEFEGMVLLGNVLFADDYVRFAVIQGAGMFAQEEYVQIPQELLGWSPNRVGFIRGSRLDHLRVRYSIKAIRSGYWDWRNERVVQFLRVREANIEWPEEFLRRLR